MGREIAKRLPGPHSTKDGYIETGGGVVTWCIGHMLGQAPPDAYDEKYKVYKFDDLPIIPQLWKLEVTGDKNKQVAVIKGLVKRATEIVNAGDPGREGQLIVDELLAYFGNKKPVLRILLNALDDATIKKELNNLHDNSQFFPLYQAGLGRQRADWLVGMNMTRAYTLLGKSSGYQGLLSVGRVQSPTLAIVVRRDEEIDKFVPKDYWTVKSLFEADDAGKPMQFWAAWLPPGASGNASEESDEEEDPTAANIAAAPGQPATGAVAPAAAVAPTRPDWLDEENRITQEAAARDIAKRVQGQTGAVTEAVRNRAQEQAPLPFDLSGIQILANSRWSASVQDTLSACQSLYEKGFTSYPRTDCCYLPESQHADAGKLLASIGQGLPAHSAAVNGATSSIKSRAWNDKKMGEHHAIIPTAQPADMSKLTALEAKVYEAVCLRFLAQFYPACEVDKAKLIIEVQAERFVARGRTIVKPGWRVVYGGGDDSDPAPDAEADAKQQEDSGDAILPALNQGDPALSKQVKIDAKKTKPPARYTEGSLLDAMKKVHLLVTDPVVRKKLKSVEGIGRSATRASIIETLVKRGFVERKAKQLISTQVGRALVNALPTRLIDPALTAMWETALDAVAIGKASLEAFMAKQEDALTRLVDAAKAQPPITNLPQGYNPAGPASKSAYKPGAGGKSGAPSGAKKPAPAGAKTCPKCKKGKMVKRTAKAGPNAGKEFLGCTNYPECKHAENPA